MVPLLQMSPKKHSQIENGLGDFKWLSQDAFHDVSDVRPFHLPHIFDPKPGTACSGPSKECKINSTTVTMPIYDFKDRMASGQTDDVWDITWESDSIHVWSM